MKAMPLELLKTRILYHIIICNRIRNRFAMCELHGIVDMKSQRSLRTSRIDDPFHSVRTNCLSPSATTFLYHPLDCSNYVAFLVVEVVRTWKGDK